MKNILKTSVLFFIALLLTITLTSCSNPIEELNSDEKNIYDAFILSVNEFNNPTEVEMLAVCKPSYHEYLKGHETTIKLKTYNEFGTQEITYYRLYLTNNNYGDEKGDTELLPYMTDSTMYKSEHAPDESLISAKKIQAAIDQYWKDQGLK